MGIFMFVCFGFFLCYRLVIEKEVRRKLILLNTSGLSGAPRKDEQEILNLGNCATESW